MMMETKLWTVLCALLLINMGSADHGNDHAAASQSTPGAAAATEAPAAVSVSVPNLQPTSLPARVLNGSDANATSTGNSSVSINVTKAVETTSQSPEPKKDNDTFTTSPVAPAVPETNSNLTEEITSQPPILPTESHTSTPHITSTTTTTTATTTTTSPPHTPHNASVDTTTTNTSNHPSPLPPDSISTSKQPIEPKTHSATSAPQPGTTATAATSTQSSSTSSTSSTQMLTSAHTSQSIAPREQAKSTNAQPSTPAAQAEAHADTPSQLNVGGDTMMVHESPTLDPLLAGLVTAFIITAVIITLLLFLKLRRRDNRPEFRRLQDLPMDDMMEDTPLSMYSY
ncbi:uncharacterized protein LOC131465757 [Solea solea]|uniref:uncharacterized protein LOC131465757 n=1 Tax=Solea solea TaxID=90069 RepID=UPI00272CBF53|nr:uncharacterized protein LOC131465757 [Solea solea]